ncbi:phytoene/squalene synthase family protein [Luteimonas cucumeris]|uniref:phytoene/squalene synthase family protein n=1 Tax=Luteimonas cucumeris TaxID=985012 RepID=UPI0011A954D9|nr:phytoene/squalene synthase family protein [Luteimonas cucumeris]
MSDPVALDGFIGKWRERWPEWAVAEVFVPAQQRQLVTAWFALLQELTDAAWAGDDPTPGSAKLGWWQEELQGWSLGRRRHPLGTVLQRHDAPWAELASALASLRASRDLPAGTGSALAALDIFAAAVAALERALFIAENSAAGTANVAATLLAVHPRWSGRDADHIRDLLAQWPVREGPRPRRIIAALARARLGRTTAVPAWRVLWTAWGAARH